MDVVRLKVDKSDLAGFATKDDLKRFATKDDLKRFATKVDLQRFATNDEMQRQFAAVFRRLDSLNDKIDSLVGVVRDNRVLFDGGQNAGVPKA